MRHYEVLLLFRLSSDPWASSSLKVCMHMHTGGVSGAPNCKLFPLAAASTATACLEKGKLSSCVVVSQ